MPDWVQNELVTRKTGTPHGNRDSGKVLHQKPQADERHPPGGPQWAALEPEPPCEIPPVLPLSKTRPARATWVLGPEERVQHHILPGGETSSLVSFNTVEETDLKLWSTPDKHWLGQQGSVLQRMQDWPLM